MFQQDQTFRETGRLEIGYSRKLCGSYTLTFKSGAQLNSWGTLMVRQLIFENAKGWVHDSLVAIDKVKVSGQSGNLHIDGEHIKQVGPDFNCSLSKPYPCDTLVANFNPPAKKQCGLCLELTNKTKGTSTNVKWQINGTDTCFSFENYQPEAFCLPKADTVFATLIVSRKSKTDTITNGPYVLHPRPQLSAEPDTTIYRGDTAQLRAKGGIKYKWSPENSMNRTQTAHPVIYPKSTTTYKVRAWNKYNCSRYDSVKVDIKVRNQRLRVRLLGNPSSFASRLRYELYEEGDVTIEIFDIQGKLIHSIAHQQQARGAYTYPLPNNLQAGVYLVRTHLSDQATVTRKLIVPR